ncbi:LuxR C-terminal-related transcriptional regulator [Pseudonocardia halophobica]|uniref:LuxR C-terminal-related transcriptional regulator n=1 Tax=Pseudonocardia halophobica TaxID=29401 RepID=UPI003D94A211
MPGDEAPPLVADRLAASRAAELVGRAEEQRVLASWLDPAGPAVGFVHGPGGIGKTALVRGTLTRLGRPWVELQGRAVEPTPRDALAELGRVLGRPVRDPAEVGGLPHRLAVLDSGAAGLDGRIARHVLDEQRPGPPEAPRPAVLELTPREQEVLSLLAEGMTNMELARALFISERTANRHVSNIYTKLGVRNRAEATRVAVEAGIAS